MSNSQDKRKPNAGSAAGGGPSAKSSGKSNTTGPKVGNKKPVAKSKAMADARKAASGGNSQTAIWVIAAVVVVALAAAGIFAVVQSNNEKEAARAQQDLGAGTVSLQDGTITWGQESAPATVDYWIDLLCPACRQYEENNADVMVKAVKDGDAKLIVHPTAILDAMTSPAGYSSRAASALMCAADKPQGYRFMQALYEQQPPEGGPGLSDEEITGIADEVGLPADWNDCYDSGEFDQVGAENTQKFDENGFPGTPTVLVNGQQLTSNSRGELENAIASAAE